MGLNGSCHRLSDEFSENDESLEDAETLQELGFEILDASLAEGIFVHSYENQRIQNFQGREA